MFSALYILAGNTHIKGALIATDPGGKLTLNTNTLTFEEIKDKSKGSNWDVGVSAGFSVGGAGFEKPAEGGSKWTPKPMDYTVGNPPEKE